MIEAQPDAGKSGGPTYRDTRAACHVGSPRSTGSAAGPGDVRGTLPAAHPAPGTLASIHARPKFVLNEMLVKATGSAATAFERGAIRTGTIALDDADRAA